MATTTSTERRVLRDSLGRPLESLRLSVTDRCNLRCRYCMPEEHYTWLPRADLLSFEELGRLVDLFCDLGVRRLRLTGGEPLLRRDLDALVALLAERERVQDLALTTNGVLLAQQAGALARAGLGRITISLDTLQPARFATLTGRDHLPEVLRGIDVARGAGFTELKLNCVVMRGVNDDELDALVAFGKQVGAEVRFIEYMDVGGATRWGAGAVVSKHEMLQRLARTYGACTPLPHDSHAPAERFRLPDGTTFGVIASTTEPFCRSCDRARLTADGLWYLCLYAPAGVDLRQALRGGASDAQLTALIGERWLARRERGAEERFHARERGPLVPLVQLRRDPHLEMHTRGG